mgnify:CR=1 FL=1
MSDIDSLVADINKNVESYNEMVYFSNDYIYASNALVEAYNSMLDIYSLSSYFSIDGVSGDGGALINQHKRILTLINDINSECDSMRESMSRQSRYIDEQKSRLEAEQAK